MRMNQRYKKVWKCNQVDSLNKCKNFKKVHTIDSGNLKLSNRKVIKDTQKITLPAVTHYYCECTKSIQHFKKGYHSWLWIRWGNLISKSYISGCFQSYFDVDKVCLPKTILFVCVPVFIGLKRILFCSIERL
jgi:hypothetical protein